MRQPAKNEGTVHNKKYEDYFHLLSKGEKKKQEKRKQSRRKPIFCVLTSVKSTVDFVGASFLPAGQRERGLLNCGDGWANLN